MSRLDPFPVHMLSFDFKKTTCSAFQGYYHCHQSGEWLLIHEGQGQIIVEERLYELKRGMLFYFQPYQIHKVRAEPSPESPYIRSIMHFNPQAVEGGIQPYPALHSFYRSLWLRQVDEHAFDVSGRMPYLEELLGLHATLQARSPLSQQMENEGLLALQMLVFLRELYEGLPPAAGSGERPLRYAEAVMAWLETRYHEPFKLEELAGGLHLSKFYVSKVFREETGSSITQYITARRMKEACILLAGTGLGMEDIGLKVGLTNPSYFCQLFKKTFGITPNRYRELQK
jgi:AraC-like DNA-binding protein